MSARYETDVVEWAEHQATLLRRLAAGERVNDQIDWVNVVEEIESVGSEQVHAVSSLLMQAIAHRLKAMGWPEARDVPTWQADGRRFAIDAADRFTPSMRQRLDVARIYRRALRTLPDSMDGNAPLALPAECPWSLDELLAEDR
ncbi:MAG TPA: DUF29 domain-containing protein [Acetobacteraceae bacterium]|jgi:hypothetical protein